MTDAWLPAAWTVRELQRWLDEATHPDDAIYLYVDHLLAVGNNGGVVITIPVGYDQEQL